jgi:hypothetical protein
LYIVRVAVRYQVSVSDLSALLFPLSLTMKALP